MKIRCKHLGLIAGLALVLSVSAALEWPADALATPGEAVPSQTATTVITLNEAAPFPAPVLFVAGGLLAVAAFLRWRQRRLRG